MPKTAGSASQWEPLRERCGLPKWPLSGDDAVSRQALRGTLPNVWTPSIGLHRGNDLPDQHTGASQGPLDQRADVPLSPAVLGKRGPYDMGPGVLVTLRGPQIRFLTSQ